MIRFRFKELLADKGFRERRVITITEVANATGINRMTLSKIANHAGYSTVTDNLDKLCNYFNCPLELLAEHIADQLTTEGVGGDSAPKDRRSI
jgi:putative transcriptional regulator